MTLAEDLEKTTVQLQKNWDELLALATQFKNERDSLRAAVEKLAEEDIYHSWALLKTDEPIDAYLTRRLGEILEGK
jgi:uncharacterized coiled-coil DUF342 family protein